MPGDQQGLPHGFRPVLVCAAAIAGGERYDDGYHQREYRDDRLLKSLIERQGFPF